MPYETMIPPQQIGDEVIDPSKLYVYHIFQMPGKPARVTYSEERRST